MAKVPYAVLRRIRSGERLTELVSVHPLPKPSNTQKHHPPYRALRGPERSLRERSLLEMLSGPRNTLYEKVLLLISVTRRYGVKRGPYVRGLS